MNMKINQPDNTDSSEPGAAVSAPVHDDMIGSASAEAKSGDSGSGDFVSMAMGAAIGAMVVVLTAVFVVLLVDRIKRKKVETSNVAVVETEAHHVPDTSMVSECGASGI